MTKREWTPEQKQAASDRMKQINADKKAQATKEATRIPLGEELDILAVKDQDPNYVYRWVNDLENGIEKRKQRGYVHVDSATVGDSGVDGTHNESGVVSKDVGKGVTAYLMKQKREWYEQDKATKARMVDETEESIRRDKTDNRNDGQYGEIKIGK